jgi:hypothetical protein
VPEFGGAYDFSMPTVSLRAHYDGKTIRLDEPFELSEGTRLIVTVLEPRQSGQERDTWSELSARGLARAYGDAEPEYSDADLVP